MTSTLPPIVQAFSGAMGSAAANAVAYPLDLITTRQQTTKNPNLIGLRGAVAIVRYTVHKHGLAALYDGLESDTASTILSNFCYFYAYTLLRALLLRRRRHSLVQSPSTSRAPATVLSVPQELILGFVAGIASKLVSTPLSIVTVRLQIAREDEEENGVEGKQESESGLSAVVRAIYSEDGLAGFWRGFKTTVLLCMNPALTFALLQLYRRLFVRRTTRRAGVLSPGHAFLDAAVANSLANTILYPLILMKTRAQLSPPPPPIQLPLNGTASEFDKPPATVKPALSRRVTQAGVPYPGGAYQALSAQIAKGFVGQGLTFLVKQHVETAFVRWAKARKIWFGAQVKFRARTLSESIRLGSQLPWVRHPRQLRRLCECAEFIRSICQTLAFGVQGTG